MAAILKIQDGRQKKIGKNVNISFQIQQVVSFLKMYSLANLQEMPTKV